METETYRRTPTDTNRCPNCDATGYMGIYQMSQHGSKYICPSCGHTSSSGDF